MAKINVLSPYHIYFTEANLDSAKIDLYIYTGTQVTSRPVTPTYTIEQNSISDKIDFEVSELIKDFIDISFNGAYVSNTIWFDYQITRTVSAVAQTPETIVLLNAFYGYGYFSEGVNPVLTGGLLQSNTTICKLDDAPLTIPIYQDEVTSVTFSYNNEDIYTEAITPVLTDDKIIRYISNGINGIDSFEERVKDDGGTFENSTCLQSFFDEFETELVDTVYVDTTSGVLVLSVKNISECKYEPIKLTFLNKFGAQQSIWFFKNNIKRNKLKSTDYKANILVDGSYTTSAHQRNVIRKEANESLTINSGYYPEAHNEIFNQILQSEYVWIEYLGNTEPVIIKTSSFKNKTVLTDDLISYTFELDFAYDKINNVR